jgi:hypothetical protein
MIIYIYIYCLFIYVYIHSLFRFRWRWCRLLLGRGGEGFSGAVGWGSWRGLVVAERGTGRCDVGLGGATRDASRWDTNMVAGGARYQIQWVAAKARRVTWG